MRALFAARAGHRGWGKIAEGLAVFLMGALLVASSGLAAAQPASPTGSAEAAETLFERAAREEDRGDFAAAQDDDRACIAASPDGRWAAPAAGRIAWLAARSEGGFAPLARLERVRRDPALARDPAAIDALARDLRRFPPGQVRTEARMMVAEAWLRTLHREGDALPLLRETRDDPAVDALTARVAERTLVDALAEESPDGAASEARARADLLDAGFVAQTLRIARRRTFRWASFAELGAFGLFASLACLRARRRGALPSVVRTTASFTPLAVTFGAYVAVAGGLLASRYEPGNASPFVALALALVPIVLLARSWSAAGSTRGTARAARALVTGASVLATAFVLLDSLHPEYLEGFGL